MNGFIILMIPTTICTLVLLLHDKLNMIRFIPILWFIRWFHFYFLFFVCFYPLLFPKKYDLFYLFIILLLLIHWATFRGECILSYFEKKILNPEYKLGDDRTNHPYIDIIFNKRLQILWTVSGILMFLAFSFVIIRFVKTHTNSLYIDLSTYLIILIITLLIILINIYKEND